MTVPIIPRKVFTSNAVIELETCYSADKKAFSIADSFKKELNTAHVWGYTDKCKAIPFARETYNWNGDWLEVKK